MHGGDQDQDDDASTANEPERVTVPDDAPAEQTSADGVPGEPLTGRPPAGTPQADANDEAGLLLPDAPPKQPVAMVGESAVPRTGAATWYRTDEDRNRSVKRLANPWYRRLARGVIGLSLVTLLGLGLYFGARVVQDFLDRDRLPSPGAEVPTVRATSFEIRSTTPAPVLDGTLTMDAQTGAFEFTGRGTGTQAGIQVVSPDGVVTYVRRGDGQWQVATADDTVSADVLEAVSYLRNDDSADDILTSQLRRGYVDLIERTEIGEGSDEVRVYELRLDTANFRDDFPLQYQEFADRAIPGVQPVRGLLVTIRLDDENVLVGVDDMTSNWSWQRLSYSDQPFRPLDPAETLLDGTITITDGNL